MIAKQNQHRKQERKPCASCPFLPNNHKEFGEVAANLCKKFGQPKPDFFQTLTIRQRVTTDAIQKGKLQCHVSVYDAKMNAHPETSKSCVGLAEFIKKRKTK